MAKFIPFANLSKKTQQAINQSRRKSLGNIDPLTKRPANSKAYIRKKAQGWKDNFPTPELFIFYKSLYRLCRYVSAERSC